MPDCVGVIPVLLSGGVASDGSLTRGGVFEDNLDGDSAPPVVSNHLLGFTAVSDWSRAPP